MDTNAQRKAQQRVDQINSFRQELAQLEREEALVLTPEQQSGLNAHHDRLLTDLTQQYDVEVTESGKRVSWGMRITALLGGAAFCAALVLFLHRIWGGLPSSAQVLILSVIPLLLLLAAEFISRLRVGLYYTGLLVLAAVVAFVLELNAMGNIFNLTPSAQALLVWGGFALLLAHAYGLRLTLGAGVLLLCGYTGATLYSLSGGYWTDFMARPETLLPGAIIAYTLPALVYKQDRNDFGFVFRFCGAACVFLALLCLALDGHTYAGRLPERTVETVYQFVGLLASAALVLHGIRLGRGGMVNLGALAFIIFLYVKLHTWWWAWLPKYLFFLLIGLIALLLLYCFRRVHASLSETEGSFVQPGCDSSVEQLRKDAPMKHILIIGAGIVVLVTQASVLMSVSQNRQEAPGGTIELTERELHLPRASGESTAVFLELEWDTLMAPEDHRRAPVWLDAAKLSALGFDCHMPVSHARAGEYYKSLSARPVFVVLEYASQAWKSAPSDRRQTTRLFAVDAGRDARQLREQYADTNRYIITRALVGLIFQDRSVPEGRLLPQPRLQGRINWIMPNQIFVPRPHSQILQGLRGRDHGDQEPDHRAPRFAATIAWGERHEPWVTALRRLPEDVPSDTGP